jgi:hypothetical protein
VTVFIENLLIGFHPGNGESHRHGRRKGIEPFFFEAGYAGKRLEIAFDRRQGMIDPAGDLDRLPAVYPVANRDPAMRHPGADLLLLVGCVFPHYAGPTGGHPPRAGHQSLFKM